jgi:hypothetical protein
MMLTRGFSPAGARRRACARHLAQAVLGPQPVHRAVGALPLVFVDGARQEALDVGALGRDAAADHLGDRAGDHHAGQVGVEHGMVRALHRAFGAFAAELLFGQAGDDDRQLVRRQRVGVVQHAGHRQVLAAHRAVDHDLQALDRGEHVHRAPVAAGAVVVQTSIRSSPRPCALRISLSSWRASRRGTRAVTGCPSQTPAGRRADTSPKKSRIGRSAPCWRWRR